MAKQLRYFGSLKNKSLHISCRHRQQTPSPTRKYFKYRVHRIEVLVPLVARRRMLSLPDVALRRDGHIEGWTARYCNAVQRM